MVGIVTRGERYDPGGVGREGGGRVGRRESRGEGEKKRRDSGGEGEKKTERDQEDKRMSE